VGRWTLLLVKRRKIDSASAVPSRNAVAKLDELVVNSNSMATTRGSSHQGLRFQDDSSIALRLNARNTQFWWFEQA
jgi:hypothetical protein